jgi:MaoC like domain
MSSEQHLGGDLITLNLGFNGLWINIALFTEIGGDRNPLHYDEAAAKASRFGEIVVQGGITSVILNAVVAEELPGPGTVFLNVNWPLKHRSAAVTQIRAASKSSRRAPTNRSSNCAPPSPVTTEPSFWAEQRFATRWISPPGPSGEIRPRTAVLLRGRQLARAVWSRYFRWLRRDLQHVGTRRYVSGR